MGEPEGSLNPPLPFPNSTVKLFESKFATAISGLPSWSRSPIANQKGPTPASTGGPGVNWPLPSPIRIDTSLEPWLATARSGLPSRLKSPTATESGKLPVATGDPTALANPPPPSPNKIVTLSVKTLVTARSALPSLLKSPTSTALQKKPATAGGPAENPPLPSPRRIFRPLVPSKVATARSGLPSRLKSPTAMDLGFTVAGGARGLRESAVAVSQLDCQVVCGRLPQRSRAYRPD